MNMHETLQRLRRELDEQYAGCDAAQYRLGGVAER